MDSTVQLPARGRNLIDVNEALLDLALAELDELRAGHRAAAAALIDAQAIVRRHAGIPVGAEV